MISGYVIISKTGILLYSKFFHDIKMDTEKLAMFSGGILALETFMKNAVERSIDEVIAGDWKIDFEVRENLAIVGVLGKKYNNLTKPFAKKIADIIESNCTPSDMESPDACNKIEQLIEESGINKEIIESNKALNKLKYI
ncbi:MAG: hypothetical protein ACP6IS_07125 [Candidatus Asgardarchaeia archaeon]